MSTSAKMFGFLPVMNGRITFDEELKGIVCAANCGSDYNIVTVELNEKTQTATLNKVFDTNIISGSGLSIYDYRPFIYDRKLQHCYSIVQGADYKWYIINSSVDGEGVATHTPTGLTEFDSIGGAFVYYDNLAAETSSTRAFYYSTNRKYIYILLKLSDNTHKWVKVALSSGTQTLINEDIYDSEHYDGWSEDVETNDKTEVEEILENTLYYDGLAEELPELPELPPAFSANGGGLVNTTYGFYVGCSGGGGGGGGYYGGGGGAGGSGACCGGAGGGGGGGSSYVHASLSNAHYETGIKTGNGKVVLNGVTYSCNSSVKLLAGNYSVEAWGASGGDSSYDENTPEHYLGLKGSGGKGAYVSATLSLSKTTTVYIYIGGAGITGFSKYSSGGTGGGASDIRIGGKELENRMLVAGGGGGAGAPQSRSTTGVPPQVQGHVNPAYKSTHPPHGGDGGYTGSHGENDQALNNSHSGYGGSGGTQSAGGTKGALPPFAGGICGYIYAEDGQLGVGGMGGANIRMCSHGDELTELPEPPSLQASLETKLFYNAPAKESLNRIFQEVRKFEFTSAELDIIIEETAYYLNTFDKSNIISATGYKTIDGETTYYQDLDYTLMGVQRRGLHKYVSVSPYQCYYSDWHDPLPFISVGGQTYLLVAKNGLNSEGEETHTLGFLNIDTRAFISTGRTVYDSTHHIYVAPDNSYALLAPSDSNPIMLFSNGNFSNTSYINLITIDTIERKKTLMCTYFMDPTNPPAIIDYSPASPKVYAIDRETYYDMPRFTNKKIYASLSEGYYIYHGNIGKLMLTDFEEDDEPGDFNIPSFDGYAGKAWIKWYTVDDMLGSDELFEAPLIQ
jgi:hypothetical protein